MKAVLIILLSSIMLFTGCSIENSQEETEQPEKIVIYSEDIEDQEDLKLTVKPHFYSYDYYPGVSATFKNNTDKTIKNIKVVLYLLDNEGELMVTKLATADSLEPGKEWEFYVSYNSAELYTSAANVTKCEISEMTYEIE